jgi:hypothetical protein
MLALQVHATGGRMTAAVSITTEPLTTRLNNGATVLARLYKGRPISRTYANLTQARAAQKKLGDGWGVCCWGRPFYVTRIDRDGNVWVPPVEKVRATITYLKKCIELRASGAPVAYTTDPAWLLDMAIGRRAGWVEDPHARGICMPVNGKLPRKATGDAERHLCQLAHAINSNVRVRPSELGEWRSYLLSRLPGRFTFPEDE